MVGKIDIKEIYLGKAAAENEKEDLHNYFVPTRAYRNAKDNRKRKLFYIAHRGSGKSALFNQLSYEYSKKKSNVLIHINPAEYSYETFLKLKHSFLDIKASYSIAWEYTLIIQLFIETINYFNQNPHIKKYKEDIKIINDFLENNNFKNSQSRLEIFLDFLSRISKSKLSLKFCGFEVSKEPTNSPTKDLIGLYNLDSIKLPLRSLERICQTHSIYIFIDELDTGWNNTPEARNFISGLIAASIRINNIRGIKVFLSLRQDMYNNLSTAFSDTEKIRDEIEYINWDEGSLTSIICNRIIQNKEVEKHTEHLKYLSTAEILGLIFEEGVFKNLLESTLFRPREVIHFSNLAIDKYSETYQTRKLYNSKIDQKTINSIRNKFSNDRFNDFCAEFNHEFPEIRTFLINFEGEKVTYEKNEFLFKLEEFMLAFFDRYPNIDWIKDYFDSPIKLLSKLFNIGFIKISLNKKNYFAYYEKKPMNFDNVKSVTVNKVFSSALDCVK